jgi:phytoene/squalene synthetase
MGKSVIGRNQPKFFAYTYVMKITTAQPNSIAASITKAASQQTYYTIRFLADRGRTANAYRAYAYFRWVDDTLDGELNGAIEASERLVFVNRQKSLLDACYRGEWPRDVNPQEKMLVELVQSDVEKNSGLQIYLRNMMAVMSFDADRRGRVISQAELNEYTRCLASSVTEAMHYFIGHCCYSPDNEARYLAVTAAHITHMLRDTVDDIQAGYFNIPYEVLEANHISPGDIQSNAYRTWVQGRVQLARTYFKAGREYLDQVENLRCRLAGLAYFTRFEGVLDLIERDGFLLRPVYPERKVPSSIAWALGAVLSSIINRRGEHLVRHSAPSRQRSLREL